jgi:hypothetical protein
MSDDVTFEMTGLDELQKALEKLGNEAGRDIVKDGLSQGGDVLRDAMRVNTAASFIGEPKTVAAQQSSWSKSTKMEEDLAGTVRVAPKGKLVDLHVSRGHGRQPLGRIYRRSLAYLVKLAEFGSSGGKERGLIKHSMPMSRGFEQYKSVVFDKVIEVIKSALPLDSTE